MKKYCMVMHAIAACLLGASVASANTFVDVYAQQHYTGEGGPYAHGSSDAGDHYAAVGTFVDEFGDPLPEPIGWSYHDTLTGSSMTAWAEGYADLGVLKARCYLEYDKNTTERETFHIAAGVGYSESIVITGADEMYVGNHYMIVNYHVSGSYVETGLTQASLGLTATVDDGSGGMYVEGGEGDCDGECGGEGGGEDGEGPMPQTIFSPGYNFGSGIYDTNAELYIEGYVGQTINIDLSLGLSIYGAVNVSWDSLAEGEGTLDFYNTVAVQSVSLFDGNDDLVVQFAPDGSVLGGDATGLQFTYDVPEPASIMLLALGLTALAKRR